MDGFEDIVKEFLVESYESLDQLDGDFVALEDTPNDCERLASIFRTVHTIKGTSGFLALPKLEKIAHVGENLLVPLRDGELRLNRSIADSLLGMVDAIREILQCIERDGSEGDKSYSSLIQELERLLRSGGHPQKDDNEEATNQELARTTVDAALPESSTNRADSSSDRESGKKAVEVKLESLDRSNSVAESSVRIDVGILDKLMNLVGELVLARNQVLQFSESIQDPGLNSASQRLNLITTELQEGVIKTRMQPIRNAWSKLPRVVRDLSSTCGKSVAVQMEGADTELDKTVLEAIKDPLTHIVRNSVDHGIEPSDARLAAGKPPQGTIRLRAFHEGGQVIVEISDDGGGIDVDRIREKAINNGLVTSEHAATLNERELTNLILLPGFSTAQAVTNVSGRGVGMDVVKTNIERIGGTLDIQSELGQWTKLRIKIPLTLAIVPALIVTAGPNLYAIPQVNLLELVRLSGERAKKIEYIHDKPVYRLRGSLLPLIYLDEQLELRRPRKRNERNDSTNIIVLQAENRIFGLVVDSVTDTQEIVVKPLGAHLKNIPTFAGAAIMGDGKVALILDAIGLARRGSILTQQSDRPPTERQSNGQIDKARLTSYLIIESESQIRSAIKLSSVARLEKFPVSRIETTQTGKAIQYRGDIMPLIFFDHQFNSEPVEHVHVVVYSSGATNIGFVVGKIVDILDVADERMKDRIVVQKRVTEILDLERIVEGTFPKKLALA